jgi:hypothetical protein
VSAATRPGGDGAVTPGQLLAGLLLAGVVLWLLAPFAGADPPRRLTVSNAPWTDEGFNLANARERALGGQFATGDVDRSLTNGVYSVLGAATFAVTGPSLAAGRALSMAAVAGAVLLLALGLARPLGRPAALLGGANLMLEHGRLALVEATVVVLLTGAFVLATRAAWRPSAAAGAGVGLLVAAAVSIKANALLPGVVLLGVVLVAAARRRDRPALVMGLAGLATLVMAGAAWLVAVALPNWDRLRTALRIWPTVEYLGTPAAIAGRVGRYLADSDQALGRSLPLLLAAALGLAALARRWRGLDPAARPLHRPQPLCRPGAARAGRPGRVRARRPRRPGRPVPRGGGGARPREPRPGRVGGRDGRGCARGRGGRARGAPVPGRGEGQRPPPRTGAAGPGHLAAVGRGGVRGVCPDPAVRHPADHPDAVADRRRQRPRPGGAVRGDPRPGQQRAGRPDGEGDRPHRPDPAQPGPGPVGERRAVPVRPAEPHRARGVAGYLAD